jgi:predicted nucleotidyltransferase
MPDGRSAWRDDRSWQRRVARDRQLLGERLNDDQMTVVRGVVEAADAQGVLDFVVVFGSVARGDHDDESDLDIYFETGDLNAPYAIPHPDFPEYEILGLPRSGLVDALRGGQEFAFNVVRDGLIHVDNGRYRDVLVAVDEEGLAPDDPAGAQA